MNALYNVFGYIMWYGSFVAAFTAILSVPFIWMPSVWSYTICGVAITKYILVAVSTIIVLKTVTITIL